MENDLIRVLCVDDHLIVREGLAFIIDSQPDMKVVATAGSGEDAVALYRAHRPDVTIMDLRSPGIGGVEAIRQIRLEFADARIVVLTAYQGDEDVYAALKAGASSYVLKDSISYELIRVIRAVHAGERPLSPELAAILDEHGERPTLSPRERMVLELMAAGMRNKEIAAALGVSELTTQAFSKRLFAKLKVSDRTAAVTVALRRGIIHLS